MEIAEIIPHIEALIFASEKPLTSMELTELINNAFGFMEEKLTLEQVQTALDGIIEKYASAFYPFEVRESGGGWQFLTKKDYHKTVGQLNGDKFLKRLSSAALETLAIIAYKQPITKGEIEAIRGVSSDYSIQKLLEKELIIIAGRNEEMPGKPLIYTTSKTFMDYFGLNSPADLPKLKEIFSETLAEATIVTQAGGGTSSAEDASGPSGNEAAPSAETAAPEDSETASDTGDAPGEDTDATVLVVSSNGELTEHEEAEEQQEQDLEGSPEETAGQIEGIAGEEPDEAEESDEEEQSRTEKESDPDGEISDDETPEEDQKGSGDQEDEEDNKDNEDQEDIDHPRKR